ncbi:caspase domain-containing protein [Xylaria arbuscula]|nr:caspase domain-containing protein [Xylaria arbuscula]
MVTPTVPKRFALLVGVDLYLNDGSRRHKDGNAVSLTHLKGALNDVTYIRSLLQDQFLFDQLTVLTSSPSQNDPNVPQELENDWPTHANVKGTFENIRNEAGPGDIFFFHFSGHGAPLEPVLGSPNIGSGNDLSLMTVDYCCKKPAIRGWELNEWLRQFHEKGVRVIVLLDSCYSGGAWRADIRFRSPDNWTPPPNVPADEVAVQGTQKKPGHREGDLDVCWDLNPRDFTLMTACQNNEKAAEKSENEKVYGAFTLALMKYFQTPSHPFNSTYRAICDHTATQIASWELPQNPRVFGRDRLAFLEDFEPISATPVFGTLNDGIVTLPVGKIHGINRRSQFVTVSISSPKVIVSVDKVSDLESKAKIIGGSVQNPSQSGWFIPFRWSSENTLKIIMDPSIAHSFQQKLIGHLNDRIIGDIQYTKGTEMTKDETSQVEWFRLGMKEDGGIDIFGPEQILGGRGPVRGLKARGGTDDERARESAIALAHLVRFGQIFHLRNELEDTTTFQITIDFHAEEDAKNDVDYVFQNNDNEDLCFAILILSPGFHVKQLFPATDTLQAVPSGGRLPVPFSLTVPDQLERDANDQQHACRDIVRTVVTKGRSVSLKCMELPDIWNADQWDNRRTDGFGRDGSLRDHFSWWIQDEEFIR